MKTFKKIALGTIALSLGTAGLTLAVQGKTSLLSKPLLEMRAIP